MEESPFLQEEEPIHLVPFISDYGFKVTFGDENSAFTKKAIELLAQLDQPIEKLTMLRSEFAGINAEQRSGIYDVFCRDEKSQLFILELQATSYVFFKERLLFYIFYLFISMIRKGKGGFQDIQPIHCICIVENRIMEEGGYYQRIKFRSEKGHAFYEDIELHLVELGKFPIKKGEYHKLQTELDELIYTMKYGHQIDLRKAIQVPPFWGKDWLEAAIQKLDQRKMTADDRVLLEIGIVKVNMIHYEQQMLLENAKAEGEAKGMAEGKEEGRKQRIIKSLQTGKLTLKEIAEDFEVLEAYIPKIKKEMDAPSSPPAPTIMPSA